jgi:hypothetical protein
MELISLFNTRGHILAGLLIPKFMALTSDFPEKRILFFSNYSSSFQLSLYQSTIFAVPIRDAALQQRVSFV